MRPVHGSRPGQSRCATTSTEHAALTYAAGGWLVLVAFYDRVMNLFWYPTLFADWLEDLLPDWFPDWLII